MRGTSLSHDVLLYRGPHDLARQVMPVIDRARTQGAAIVVAVPSSVVDHVAPLLGDDPMESITVIDEVGRNPGRFIELWAAALATARRSGRPLLGLGQPIWAGRSAEEIEECWISESLFDSAFDDAGDFRLVCLYDLDLVEPAAGDRAAAIHHGHGPHDRSPLSSLLTRPLAPAPDDAHHLSVGIDDLAALRDQVRALGATAGLGGHRVDDLVLATNELASNSVRHGGGTGDVALWRDADSVWCDVVDDGTIVDPMVGRRRPPEHDLGGRGVWIAHQVCDLVQVRSCDRRTHVRVRMSVA